jgi:hypothetical protein
MRGMTHTQVRAHPARVPEGSASISPSQPASLPAWDLSDLYPAIDSPRVTADLDATDEAAAAFNERYAGKLAGLPGAGLAQALAEYERIEESLGRVMSFAQLKFAGDSTSGEIGQFMQSCSERVTAISSHLIFFSLELNRLPTLPSPAGSPSCATCVYSARTSSRTRRRSCCTTNPSPVTRPGAGCSTRRSPACASRSARRTSPSATC